MYDVIGDVIDVTIVIYLTMKIIFSLYMQKIYINIFQKTNLIELLKYRIHETN